jgi:hypothetical protein
MHAWQPRRCRSSIRRSRRSIHDRHRERPAQPSPHPGDGDLRRRKAPTCTPRTSMRTCGQLPPGLPTTARRAGAADAPCPGHGLCHSTELLTGARPTRRTPARRQADGDHVELSVAAPPVAGQHPPPPRGQALDSQLLTQRPDLGAARGVLRHDPTVPGRADTAGTTHGNHAQSPIHPQPAATSGPRPRRRASKSTPAHKVTTEVSACRQLV